MKKSKTGKTHIWDKDTNGSYTHSRTCFRTYGGTGGKPKKVWTNGKGCIAAVTCKLSSTCHIGKLCCCLISARKMPIDIAMGKAWWGEQGSEGSGWLKVEDGCWPAGNDKRVARWQCASWCDWQTLGTDPGMNARWGGNDPEDGPGASQGCPSENLGCEASACDWQKPTNIQHWTWLVRQFTLVSHGILLNWNLFMLHLQSQGSFTNNNEFKMGQAGLRTVALPGGVGHNT